jgi:hypothetical protein
MVHDVGGIAVDHLIAPVAGVRSVSLFGELDIHVAEQAAVRRCRTSGLASIARAELGHETAPLSSVEAEVIAAQQAQIIANNEADIAALDDLTADDYLGIHASGSMQNKSEFLQEVARRGPAKVKATPEQIEGAANSGEFASPEMPVS